MPTKMVLEERGSSVDTLEAGVEATSRLAVDPELEGVTGRFYDRQRESTPDPQASDPEAAQAPVGAVARARRRARAGALDRHGRRERPRGSGRTARRRRAARCRRAARRATARRQAARDRRGSSRSGSSAARPAVPRSARPGPPARTDRRPAAGRRHPANAGGPEQRLERDDERVGAQLRVAARERRAAPPAPEPDDQRLELLPPRGELVDARPAGGGSVVRRSTPAASSSRSRWDSTSGATPRQARAQVAEALRPQHELAHDQERPALADHVQRARHAAAVAVGPHRRHENSVVGLSNSMIGFSNLCRSEETEDERTQRLRTRRP